MLPLFIAPSNNEATELPSNAPCERPVNCWVHPELKPSKPDERPEACAPR